MIEICLNQGNDPFKCPKRGQKKENNKCFENIIINHWLNANALLFVIFHLGQG